MTPATVIGKLVAYEMSCKMGQEEASSSRKDHALTCDERKKIKGKKVESSVEKMGVMRKGSMEVLRMWHGIF